MRIGSTNLGGSRRLPRLHPPGRTGGIMPVQPWQSRPVSVARVRWLERGADPDLIGEAEQESRGRVA